MDTIKKLIRLLSKQEKRKLIPLTMAILVMSLTEVIGIGSLGPFMAVVADPSVVDTNGILRALYTFGDFDSTRAFLIGVGVAVFLLVVLATTFKILVLYFVYRFAAEIRHALGLRLFRRYVHQPYPYFIDHNTTELSKNLLSEVDQVVDAVLKPLLESFAKGFLVIATLTFLVATNPWVALGAGGLMGSMYAAIYGIVRPRLVSNGVELRESNRIRYKVAGETFSAIKDVKILGKEDSFSDTYSIGAMRFAKTRAARQILSTLPGHTMQAVSIGFAIGLVIVMLATSDSLATILPLLAIYAFAVQRMTPNLQAVFQAVAQIRYMGHAVDALYRDMTSLAPVTEEFAVNSPERTTELPNTFSNEIKIIDLSFSYAESESKALHNVNLTIPKNTTVGFVGTTGCGKTTLVDVVMGLLVPTEGSINADQKTVNPDERSIRRWQRNFGYVPQTIFLSDDTVAANIAFGISADMRDQLAVERSARIANLHDFIETTLPNGYETVVGERGVRLSGGQKQRIGIARALYHDPQILVMDEATSALDSVTETIVMDAIHNLMHTKTIILIAHRIATVRECDTIYVMDSGKVVAHGTYDELISNDRRFRAMANIDLQ